MVVGIHESGRYIFLYKIGSVANFEVLSDFDSCESYYDRASIYVCVCYATLSIGFVSRTLAGVYLLQHGRVVSVLFFEIHPFPFL